MLRVDACEKTGSVVLPVEKENGSWLLQKRGNAMIGLV